MEKTNYVESSLDGVVRQLKNRAGLQICGGCTFLKGLPQISLVVRNIDELRYIEKKERYMDIGSAAALSSIEELGERRIPPILYQALRATATPLVRNMATLGGNLCLQPVRGTLFAPLLAMDALLEFKTDSEIISIPMMQFISVPPLSLLTKVRIPLNEWDVALFRRVGPSWTINENCASYAFLASIQKESLVDIRIAFCGLLRFRSRELENRLNGKKLPLTQRDIGDMLEAAGGFFDRQVDVCRSGIGGEPGRGDVAVLEKERSAEESSLRQDPSERHSLPSVDFALLKARFLGLLRDSLNQLT